MLTLPDGREVPADLVGFLGRVDMASWLLAAGVENTRALLLIPAQELRFLPHLGTRARLVLDRLKSLNVAAGCLAEPAPVATVATGPPERRTAAQLALEALFPESRIQ